MKNQAILTCPDPACQHQQRAIMPSNFCQLTYTCEACSLTHRHKTGDCCVFCSYADQPCPSKQEEEQGNSLGGPIPTRSPHVF